MLRWQRGLLDMHLIAWEFRSFSVNDTGGWRRFAFAMLDSLNMGILLGLLLWVLVLKLESLKLGFWSVGTKMNEQGVTNPRAKNTPRPKNKRNHFQEVPVWARWLVKNGNNGWITSVAGVVGFIGASLMTAGVGRDYGLFLVYAAVVAFATAGYIAVQRRLDATRRSQFNLLAFESHVPR
jgi:hypothetical protein